MKNDFKRMFTVLQIQQNEIVRNRSVRDVPEVEAGISGMEGMKNASL
jgi:hypothetical protein